MSLSKIQFKLNFVGPQEFWAINSNDIFQNQLVKLDMFICSKASLSKAVCHTSIHQSRHRKPCLEQHFKRQPVLGRLLSNAGKFILQWWNCACNILEKMHLLQKYYQQLRSETLQKEIGRALFKRKGRCWRWNSMLIFRVNKSQSCNLWSLLNVHMFFPLSFYIFLSIGTLSLASHLPNSFQVRDFYVKIFPTVFFVLKAASLGEIDQREETVNF